MTHNLDTDTLAQSQAATNSPIFFLKLELDSGNICLHSQLGDIIFDGSTYTGVGQLGTIEGIEESAELSRSSVRVTLSGIEPALVSLVLGEHYQGRLATIYAGFLGLTTRLLLGTPALLFRGKVDIAPLRVSSDSATITLTIENEFADWDKPRIRRYNDADQKSRYPNDNFFKFAEQSADKQLIWGKNA
jgi:hypothetical protein